MNTSEARKCADLRQNPEERAAHKKEDIFRVKDLNLSHLEPAEREEVSSY